MLQGAFLLNYAWDLVKFRRTHVLDVSLRTKQVLEAGFWWFLLDLVMIRAFLSAQIKIVKNVV